MGQMVKEALLPWLMLELHLLTGQGDSRAAQRSGCIPMAYYVPRYRRELMSLHFTVESKLA